MHEPVIVNRAEKAEFLKGKLTDYEGKLVVFDDVENSAVIVGEGGTYTEIKGVKFSRFLLLVADLEENASRLAKRADKLFAGYQDAAEKLEKARTVEELRKSVTDPKVERALRYKATRFAIRIKSANGQDEAIAAIDRATKDMITFVQNFVAIPTEMRDFLDESDLGVNYGKE